MASSEILGPGETRHLEDAIFTDIAPHYTYCSGKPTEFPSGPLVVSLPRTSRRLPRASRLRRVIGQTMRSA